MFFVLSFTGALKIFNSGAFKKNFPFVPRWSWPLIGAFQLLTVYLMHFNGAYSAALPLVYNFFGGVIYCVIRSPGAIVPLFFTSLTLCSAWSTGVSNGFDSASMIVPYTAIGFVATLLFCAIGGSSAKPKKA